MGFTQPLRCRVQLNSANGFADDIIIQQPACVCDDNKQDLDGSNYIRKKHLEIFIAWTIVSYNLYVVSFTTDLSAYLMPIGLVHASIKVIAFNILQKKLANIFSQVMKCTGVG